MKIVIIGDGKIGYTLAHELSKEDHELVVIDSNPSALEGLMQSLDVMTVTGNGAALDIQRKAGVGDSDLLIAVTASDETNLLCCIVAKKLGCKHTISRIRNPDYSRQLAFLSKDLGLSMTVNPELAAAREIFGLVQFPSFLKRDVFARGKVEMVEFKIGEDSRIAGVQLGRLTEIINVRVLVCTVERDEKVIIPNGSFTLRAGDKITVTAARSELSRLIKNLKISSQKIKTALLIGGSRIAVYLAEELYKSGVKVKIIELDKARCKELSARLPHAIVINGDGTLQEQLREEGIEETDAVITLTDIDEENLIISMFAEHIGVPKTITKLNRTEYCLLFNDHRLGSIVCPKQLVSNDIIRYVRAMRDTVGGSVKTLYRLANGKAEALEFEVLSTTRNLGKPLAEIQLKKDILLTCITRGNNVIIPQGSDCFYAGDLVIVITSADRMITDLNDIFTDED